MVQLGPPPTALYQSAAFGQNTPALAPPPRRRFPQTWARATSTRAAPRSGRPNQARSAERETFFPVCRCGGLYFRSFGALGRQPGAGATARSTTRSRPPRGARSAQPANYTPPSGTNVAVIDVAFVFKNHDRFNATMADIKKDIDQFEAYVRGRAAEAQGQGRRTAAV